MNNRVVFVECCNVQPVMADVACHKNGSRTLEAVWKSATLRHMLAIAATLSKYESRLRGNQYGHFIWQNWALTNYTQRTKDWELAQKTAIKKRKLFTTLLETDDASTAAGKTHSLFSLLCNCFVLK